MLWLIRNCYIVTVAPPESLCFDSSPSAGEKTAVVYVFVAISRIEIQASWGSTGWPVGWLWAPAKNGERGASEGSAQIRSAHWSTQETQSMGAHQGAQTSPCCGNLLIKPDPENTYKRKKNQEMILYISVKSIPAFGFKKLSQNG